MWPWRHRPRGRHAIGAPTRVPVAIGRTADAAAAVPLVDWPAGPRVELGFWDGASVTLAENTAAFHQLAAVLTARGA